MIKGARSDIVCRFFL